jgi:hypothetical protein
MLQGAMGGPAGEGRATAPASYAAIGAGPYPPAGPILSSQVSDAHGGHWHAASQHLETRLGPDAM